MVHWILGGSLEESPLSVFLGRNCLTGYVKTDQVLFLFTYKCYCFLFKVSYIKSKEIIRLYNYYI